MAEQTWESLLPSLTDAENAEYARLIEGAGELAAVVMTALSADTRAAIAALGELNAWPEDRRRLAALRIHADAARSDRAPSPEPATAVILAGRDVSWSRMDLVWSLHVLAEELGLCDGSAQRLPALIAAALKPDQLDGLSPALEALLHEVSTSRIPIAVRRELTLLIGTGIEHAAGSHVPPHLLHSGDAFGPATRVALAGILAGPGVAEALLHCAALGKPVPPKAWSRVAQHLLEPAREAVRGILDRFVEFGADVHDDNDVLLRGLTCMLAQDPGDEATALIGNVALVAGSAHRQSAGFPYAPRTAAAATEILAGRDGDVPVQALARLSLSVKNKALLTRVHTALTRLGALRGWQPGEAQELAVDDHGLDRDGRRRWSLEGYTVLVEVAEDKARVRFERAGTPLKGVPAAVKGSTELVKAKELVKKINATLGSERTRIEALLSQDRIWSHQDWAKRYLEHPVSAVFGRRLIWQASTDGKTWAAGLPEHRDGVWTLAGHGESSQLRLWHPALAPLAEVTGWRDRIAASGLRQPFKQAFREVYLLTPAEEQTRTYSNRFAAHVLRYRQANALMRARGWHATYLGTWDGGRQSEATKLVGDGTWRASFFHDVAGEVEAPYYHVQFCATDQVRFARRDGALWETTPLTEVPARTFSEAMRDVDLFVGVTSIATDGAWADRGEDRFYPYWSSATFSALSASAEVRRDVLARILPKLKIAAQCELHDRYLQVRGTLRTYKIHLGSGNILMEPGDAYLCIVPAGRTPGTLHLPFDDDPMLSIILSKAFLLAADDKITDPTILHQLSAR